MPRSNINTGLIPFFWTPTYLYGQYFFYWVKYISNKGLINKV